MAAANTAPAPESPANGSDFMQRELNGASFLTLEHIAHMALTILVPAIVLVGVFAALSMWTGSAGPVGMMLSASTGFAAPTAKVFEALASFGIIAALLVLTPMLALFDRRTRAEWHKRPGFAGRVAYRVPVYAALGILAAVKVGLVIELVYVVVSSLAFIGIQGAPIGAMYLTNFLPALIALVVFGGAGWYVFMLAKGRDYGKKFSMVVSLFSAAVVISLIITSLVVMHNGNNSFQEPSTSSPSTSSPSFDNFNSNNDNSDNPTNSKTYQDILNQLSH